MVAAGSSEKEMLATTGPANSSLVTCAPPCAARCPDSRPRDARTLSPHCGAVRVHWRVGVHALPCVHAICATGNAQGDGGRHAGRTLTSMAMRISARYWKVSSTTTSTPAFTCNHRYAPVTRV